MFHLRGNARRLLVVAVLAVSSVLISACGDSSQGPEQGADVQGVVEEDQYFGDTDEFVGEKVTVSARVTDVLNPTSFELAADTWGDSTLLVVSAQQRNNVDVGDVVQVTGVVKGGFTYSQNAQTYALAPDAGLYGAYDSENFLVAKQIKQQVEQSSTGTSGSGG